MGLFDKLFGRKDAEGLTDDERELREYEENVYRAESGVVDNCHAEYIITAAAPATNGKVLLNGSVTEGTFKAGDEINIVLRNSQVLTSKIITIAIHMALCETATEGQNADFLIETVDPKMIKRNDLVKKLIKENNAE
ncbi:MAG: hypothetical protein IKO47_02235 [Ruminococcus sp.]|nr:hypothetical protein [Ruminococcus sp.]